jgi:5-methylcytosine-specific restriction endonuclease McrA
MAVLVLNASYEPINVCTVRRAVVLLLKEKAELLERADRDLFAVSQKLPHPLVIRLITYVRIPRTHRQRLTRRAVFARDQWTCQYCGSQTHLTLDHVTPKSKGGETTWENVVASCAPCNRRKGSHLPAEAGMRLTRPPRAPHATAFILITVRAVPAAWTAYLPA